MLNQAESCSRKMQSVLTLRPDLPWKPEVYYQQGLTCVYRDNKCTALLKPPQLSTVSNTAFKSVQLGGFTRKSIFYWDKEARWRLWSPDTAIAKETHQHSKKGNNVHATASTEWHAFLNLPPWKQKNSKGLQGILQVSQDIPQFTLITCRWRQPSLNKQINLGKEQWWVHESKDSSKAPPISFV